MIATILAVLVLAVALPLNWYTVWELWRMVRAEPPSPTMRERAFIGTALALNVTVFGLIFANNGLPSPPFDVEATRVITRGALLALSTIPALYWLRLYRNGSHR